MLANQLEAECENDAKLTTTTLTTLMDQDPLSRGAVTRATNR